MNHFSSNSEDGIPLAKKLSLRTKQSTIAVNNGMSSYNTLMICNMKEI